MKRQIRLPFRRNSSVTHDEGSALLLIIGATALVITIVFTGVSATSLYLERKRLLTLADGASLAAAEAFDLSSARFTTGHLAVQLSNDRVLQATESYLADSGEPDVRLYRAFTSDGRSATVELVRHWQPPIVTLLMPQGIDIFVTSNARTLFSAPTD